MELVDKTISFTFGYATFLKKKLTYYSYYDLKIIYQNETHIIVMHFLIKYFTTFN